MEAWKLRPARDLGLKPAERLRSLGREPGLIGLGINAAWRRGVRAYLRACHGFRVEGLENLPPGPPFVMVANHASHLDALALSAALRGHAARRAHAMAAGDLFFANPAVSALSAYAINALPVWRGRSSRGDLDTMRARLAEDHLVYILFPEGTRSRSGSMGAFQPGLGMLVAGTDIPVVPCWLQGAHEAWPPQSRTPRPFRPLHLRIGPPLRFGQVPAGRAGWQQVAAAAEAAVRLLSSERGPLNEAP
ncbi:1-acyl-sn-glycerol-3-phosphate acyltransferase [Roseomonas sp. SSH11]|uniref:1-acyl-sn-glycerol-3-phosphate acyltransferase n=1 Tax=Pararoseomonas baculiformis TaxID=2820812 RepID=A0ABS4AHI5_9PROT|nr:lysophospholipid acyltransferase family protein [Pararoseomonas baculiformis]MBP0446490.1 1-acyl-sn-glycerol-3-phosphate acyltransferase [Pararoseomonas baculiformis]